MGCPCACVQFGSETSAGTHTFCAFIDLRKAFDTAWVEATLVRLAQIGVIGGMWRTITNFLVGIW